MIWTRIKTITQTCNGCHGPHGLIENSVPKAVYGGLLKRHWLKTCLSPGQDFPLEYLRILGLGKESQTQLCIGCGCLMFWVVYYVGSICSLFCTFKTKSHWLLFNCFSLFFHHQLLFMDVQKRFLVLKIFHSVQWIHMDRPRSIIFFFSSSLLFWSVIL